MASLKESVKNPNYLFGSVTIMLFFASWGIWWSFFQIWLTSDDGGLKLNGEQVGTVYSINGIGTLALMLVYGAVQDKLDLKRYLVIAVSVVMALIGPFATWVYGPLLKSNFMLGVVLGGFVLSAGFVGACGLFEAFVERISRRNGFEFGQARMWGSFGYAVVALLAGFLFTVNPYLNFWIGSVLGVAMLLVQLLWHPKHTSAASEIVGGSEKAARPSVAEMFALLRSARVWAVIVFVLLSWTFYTVFDQQMFPDFYTSLFANPTQGQQAYGVLNSVQVFLEAIMMGVVPLVMRKVGVRTTLLLGVGVMFVRILGCAVLDGPVLISMVKMLHALEVPLFVLAIFRYFSLHFNPALSATLYLVGFNLAAQLGNVAMSTPLGRLRDSIGYQPTIFVIAGVVAVSAVWAFFALRRDDQQLIDDHPVVVEPATNHV